MHVGGWRLEVAVLCMCMGEEGWLVVRKVRELFEP